jgi:hypothetical protein
MEEEIFVDNRIIENQITEKYREVKKIMEQKLNNAHRYNEIDLRPSESKIMLEILRFHPEFEKKWKKGYKFVYANRKNDKGIFYNDIFIKSLQGELENFSKDICKKGLKRLENNFKDITKKPKIQTTLEEQVNIRKDFGICTKCFGYDKTNKKFVFCDCLLSRTDYNEFMCSNPLEIHTTISGNLLKSVHYTYDQGFEGEDLNDNQSIYSKYYVTTETITIPNKPNINRGTILYQLNNGKYIIVDDINSFRKNLEVRIKEANNNKEIITIPKGIRNLKKYDE